MAYVFQSSLSSPSRREDSRLLFCTIRLTLSWRRVTTSGIRVNSSCALSLSLSLFDSILRTYAIELLFVFLPVLSLLLASQWFWILCSLSRKNAYNQDIALQVYKKKKLALSKDELMIPKTFLNFCFDFSPIPVSNPRSSLNRFSAHRCHSLYDSPDFLV